MDGCIQNAIDVHLGSSRFKSYCFSRYSYKLEIRTRTVGYLFFKNSFKPINISSTSHSLINWQGILINRKKKINENIKCQSKQCHSWYLYRNFNIYLVRNFFSNLNHLYFMRNINTRRLLEGDNHTGGPISTEGTLFQNRYFMTIYLHIATRISP